MNFERDPSLTVDNWRVDWGDGSEILDWDGSLTQAFHTYADGPNDFTITVTAIIGGLESPVGSLPVTVQNVAPVVDSLGLDSYEIDENGNVSISGSFTDPGHDFWLLNPDTGLEELISQETHTVTINWGDASDDTVIDLDNDARRGGMLAALGKHGFAKQVKFSMLMQSHEHATQPRGVNQLVPATPAVPAVGGGIRAAIMSRMEPISTR